MKSFVCNFGNLLLYMILIFYFEFFKEKGFKIIYLFFFLVILI